MGGKLVNRHHLIANSTCEAELLASSEALQQEEKTAWRARRISVKASWLRQTSRRGVKFTHVPTKEMAADSLTKGGLGTSQLPQEDLELVDDVSCLPNHVNQYFSMSQLAHNV